MVLEKWSTADFGMIFSHPKLKEKIERFKPINRYLMTKKLNSANELPSTNKSEDATKMKCSICKQEGHNKRSCKMLTVPVSAPKIEAETDVKVELMSEIDIGKQHIITLFNTGVKGVEICLEGQNINHSGKEGHWLETKMGIKHNTKNEPDINGYEMKKSSSKTTLGDFSASEYAFSGKNKRNSINTLNNWTDEIKLSRSDFIKTFGNPNPNKNNRYSWSGSCVPIYGSWKDDSNGQILTINENNDIIIYYSFSKDTRSIKTNFPKFLQHGSIVIALWKASKMKPHIDKKFNDKGFFMCKKTGNRYEKICFGKAFNFEYFIECIKNKKIIFDSGMYDGNKRNYSQFRGSSSGFWEELITEEY